MNKLILILTVVLFISTMVFAADPVYKYHFPKVKEAWGDPISFNNLSPGFFQVMFRDNSGVIRIATYGIAGGAMDSLKDPQLLMLFVFDKAHTQISSIAD